MKIFKLQLSKCFIEINCQLSDERLALNEIVQMLLFLCSLLLLQHVVLHQVSELRAIEEFAGVL